MAKPSGRGYTRGRFAMETPMKPALPLLVAALALSACMNTAPDTPAAGGPIKGSMILYLIDEEAAENRPLELEIPGPDGEAGRIELDI